MGKETLDFELSEQGVENLVIGIVKQACFDYLANLKVIYRKPLKPELESVTTRLANCEKAVSNIYKLRRYFTSDDFKMICDLDGKMILDKLDIQFRKGLEENV